MVMLGIDAHIATHTAVAVDDVGRKIGQRMVAATDAGHRQLLGWALGQWPGDGLRFAVEDCRQVSTRVERTLLLAGQTVVRVPPKLTAGSRSSARTRGKSDPMDALAIACAALREPDLPVATLHGQFREIRLLVDHREDLVAARTQMQNRLRWHLHGLEPGQEPGPRSLDRYCELDRLTGWLADREQTVLVRLAELGRHPGVHGADQPPETGAGPAGRTDRPAAAGAAWLWGAHRREDPRRGRPGQPVPLRELLCHARRRRADPRLVGKDDPLPARPRRQPATQRRAAPASRSAKSASAAPTTSGDAQAATPPWKPSARSNAASPASSIACCTPSRRPTPSPGPPEPAPVSFQLHPVDLAPPDRAPARVQPSTPTAGRARPALRPGRRVVRPQGGQRDEAHPHPGRPARPARTALDLRRGRDLT